MSEMSAARFIAQTLAAYEVTHIFFVPAILSRTLVELERHTDITRIMTHGENSAAYMADGYARVSGKPGICFSQCIGAANLAAALRDPYLACSPMVVLTGGPYSDQRHRHSYQEIDDFSLFGPVTHYSARVEDAGQLPEMLRQAFRSATSGCPGPTHLELAGHLGELENQIGDFELQIEAQHSRIPAWRPPADSKSVKSVVRLLNEATRPVIIAGGGVRSSGAGQALQELAETLLIPVATSLNAKDVIRGDHPLNVGVPGWYCRKSANRTVLESDLVFFVGSHTGSQVTYKWQVPPMGTPVVQLDIDPEELGRHYPNKESLLGDARTVLLQMLDHCNTDSQSIREPWVARTREMSSEWRDEFHSTMHSNAIPIRPERVCQELTNLMPKDCILVSDTGHSGMWTGGMIDLNKSGQQYIRAAGSLGWGLPAALGAKLAAPERPVVLFSGDGGFWYHLSELETAARWNIPVVLLINNNRSLNQELDLYTEAYGGALEGRHADLWHFNDSSFAEIARAMGVGGICVNKPEQLSSALEAAFEMQRPCVVEVLTEITAVAPLAYTG